MYLEDDSFKWLIWYYNSACVFNKGTSLFFWKLMFWYFIIKNIILHNLNKFFFTKKFIFEHFKKQIWISRQSFPLQLSMNFEICSKLIKKPNFKWVYLWTMFLDLLPYRKQRQISSPNCFPLLFCESSTSRGWEPLPVWVKLVLY